MRVAKKFFSFLLAVVLMGTSVFPAAAFESMGETGCPLDADGKTGRLRFPYGRGGTGRARLLRWS